MHRNDISDAFENAHEPDDAHPLHCLESSAVIPQIHGALLLLSLCTAAATSCSVAGSRPSSKCGPRSAGTDDSGQLI